MPPDQDDKIRNYLLALKRPESLRDDERIAESVQKLDSCDDPLERLQLRAEVKRLQAVGPKDFEPDFISEAKQWAEAHDVTADVFIDEGVPEEVLRQAGFETHAPTTPRSSRRVSRDEVQRAILSQDAEFTVDDIVARCGASHATVRKVLDELSRDGRVRKEGRKGGQDGLGRPPMTYSLEGA